MRCVPKKQKTSRDDFKILYEKRGREKATRKKNQVTRDNEKRGGGKSKGGYPIHPPLSLSLSPSLKLAD